MITLAKRFDRWLHSHLPLLLALLLLLILRIPNFFEPYWYGDEGIYLTVGQAIRDGEKLYTEIVDHKTPLIYYFASVPNQLSFRVLTVFWMIVTTSAFYAVAKKLLSKNRGVNVATFLFVILTSVPWFEGNVPNGELFAMGFILLGGWLLSTTKLMDLFLNKKKVMRGVKDPGKIFAAGLFFGLAILTKVPAILDVAGWGLVAWFALTNRWSWLKDGKNKVRRWWRLGKRILWQVLILGAGVLTPIVLSIIYYVAAGSGQDYLQFGLLYNFHYTANWGLPFTNPTLQQLFTLPGKFVLTALLLLVVTLWRDRLKPNLQLLLSWFGLALFAALLSNRPYPHYFQQILPPLSLLLGLAVIQLKKWRQAWLGLSLSLISLLVAAGALLLLDFHPYPTVAYYQRFYQLITQQKTLSAYRQEFNYYMTDNYQAAEIIKQSGVDEIFIWGTNPMLYALSETQPTGRFTVSFHIKDLGVYEETLAAVKNKQPLFVVVMKNETQDLVGLEKYLEENYIMNANFENFWLWKKFEQ